MASAAPAFSLEVGAPRCAKPEVVDRPTTRLPHLIVEPAPAGSAVVEALAAPAWCAGTWTLEVTGKVARLRLAAGAADRSCGTCTRTFTLSRLGAGDWTVAFPGASTTVTVR